MESLADIGSSTSSKTLVHTQTPTGHEAFSLMLLDRVERLEEIIDRLSHLVPGSVGGYESNNESPKNNKLGNLNNDNACARIFECADPCCLASAAYLRIHMRANMLDKLKQVMMRSDMYVSMYTYNTCVSSLLPNLVKIAMKIPDGDVITVQLLIQFNRTCALSRFAMDLIRMVGVEHMVPIEDRNVGYNNDNENENENERGNHYNHSNIFQDDGVKAVLLQPIKGAHVEENGLSDPLFVYYHHRFAISHSKTEARELEQFKKNMLSSKTSMHSKSPNQSRIRRGKVPGKLGNSNHNKIPNTYNMTPSSQSSVYNPLYANGGKHGSCPCLGAGFSESGGSGGSGGSCYWIQQNQDFAFSRDAPSQCPISQHQHIYKNIIEPLEI